MKVNFSELKVPDGLIAVVKQDCPACQLLVPVFKQLANNSGITVYSQDNPSFPIEAGWVIDDSELAVSWHLNLDAVPTLLRVENGVEIARTTGWDRLAWQNLTKQKNLGLELPDFKPG